MTEFRQVVSEVTRRWWLVLATAVVGALLGLVYALVVPPTYTANAYVIVSALDPKDTAIATNTAQAYGRVITQPDMLARSAVELDVPLDQLLEQVYASTSPEAPLIDVTGTARDPLLAASVANSAATNFVAYGNTRINDTGTRLSVFSRAIPPTEPEAPVLALDVVVGAAVGLLLGGLAAGAGISGPDLAWRRRADAAAAADSDGEDATGPMQLDETPRNGENVGHRPVGPATTPSIPEVDGEDDRIAVPRQ
jgi:capsular polysaccharide biosynthesis protein